MLSRFHKAMLGCVRARAYFAIGPGERGSLQQAAAFGAVFNHMRWQQQQTCSSAVRCWYANALPEGGGPTALVVCVKTTLTRS